MSEAVMNNKNRVTTNEISRVMADRRTRESGYIMSSYHAHPYYELTFIEMGSCRYMIEDNMYDLHDNDFMLLPPNVYHYTSYLFGDCRRCCIYFRKEDISQELIEMMPGGEDFFRQLRIFQVSDINRRKIDDTLKQMSDEETCNDRRSPALLQLLLHVLLMQCSRICTFLPDAPSKIFTADPQVLQAARFINENYRVQLNAADIAGAVGFSPNYLSRKFKDTTGMGVHEYLIYVRLRNAAFELRSTNQSVTEIALQCGFSNSNYFKDVFKKYYSMTPREYRKTH